MSPHAYVDELGYLCHRCPFCTGPSHPATGCVYAPGWVACYRCTVEAWAWIRRHTDGAGRRRGLLFYEHAAPLEVPCAAR